jgi:hypothetical protein
MKAPRLVATLPALCTAVLLALLPAAPVNAEAQIVVEAGPAPVPVPVQPDQGPFALDRVARARENLSAILDGRLNINALSQLELQDVIDLDRALRGTARPQTSFRQQCIDDEVRSAGGRPSRLAWEVIRLKCR